LLLPLTTPRLILSGFLSARNFSVTPGHTTWAEHSCETLVVW
jgi:hypothetical protein